MNYKEDREVAKASKQNYANDLLALIRTRQAEAQRIRDSYITDIFTDPERYRREFREMLGWPLTEHFDGVPTMQSTRLAEENGYEIHRMTFEILDNVRMRGLLFKKGEEKKPLIVASHGGLGTPELISGFYESTENYNDMLERVLRYDVHVFAPQLLLWSDVYDVPYDRKSIDGALKSVGSSITAVEMHGISRILDWFEVQSYVKNFGMVGLSYGGFYTLFEAAADTRIRSAVSCSFFNDRYAVAWTDWLWEKAAYRFNDAEVTALCYPRRLCIEMGANDELFDSRRTASTFDRLCKLADEKGVGTDWVDLILFDGKHEFCRDDAPLARMVKDLTEAPLQ